MQKIFKAVLVVVVVTIPMAVSYYFGVFSNSFNTNMCYSEVLGEIRQRMESANKSGDSELYFNLEKTLNRLPLRGYETDCLEVKNAVKNL